MRLYVEVTHTERNDMNAGIPRVVRNILKNLLELGPAEGIAIVPTVFRKKSFVAVSPKDVLKNTAVEQETCGISPLRVEWANRVRRGFSVSRRHLLELVGLHSSIVQLIEAEPNERHVLLLLDASWAYDIWPAVEALKTRGVRVVGVIYDLIPITHRHTVVEHLAQAFEPWLRGEMRCADQIVCISRFIANIVEGYFEKQMALLGIARDIPVSTFRLGADGDLGKSGNVVQERVLRLRSDSSPFFLMVGTVEPRKNHRQVLDAFKELWAQGFAARLVIVGERDWKSEELLTKIREDPEAERRLFLIRNASDTDLRWLYENATALVMASDIEGCGLPMVEAHQLGLPVICSNIPVFVEFAVEGTAFFRLGDVDDLARVIKAHVTSDGARVRRSGRWITWRESTQELLSAVVHAVP